MCAHFMSSPTDIAATLLWTGASGLCALATLHLLSALDANTRIRSMPIALLLPCIGIEAALVDPASMLAAAAALMALAAAVNRRHRQLLFWIGVAPALQAQAILMLPFGIALLIQRRIALRLWLIAPVTASVVTAATALIGWPDMGLASIGSEPLSLTDLSNGAPMIWALVDSLVIGETPPLLGLGITVTIGAIAAYIARFSTQPLHGASLISAALLSMLITAGLMPYATVSCFFLANIVALVGALGTRGRARFDVALLAQTGTMLALLGQATSLPLLAAVGAIPMMVATWRIAQPLLQPAANDNPLLPRLA